jgi:glycosyltransferase involved in cell wall biosynthesis
MKIVRIIARLNVGGPARHVVWLTEAMQSGEFDSVLISGIVPEGEEDMSYFAAQHSVVPIIIPEMSRELSPKDAVSLWKVYRRFLKEKPDIIDTHTAKAGTVGRAAGFLYRWLTFGAVIGRPRPVRFVHTYHGHVFHSYYGKLKTNFFLFVEKMLARVTDVIIVVSEQQKAEINNRFRVGKTKQFTVMACGIDLSVFKDWKAKRNILRQEIGCGDDEIIVGIVGRLTEIKNHSLFLQTAKLYKDLRNTDSEIPALRFVIVGDGHLRAQLEREAKDLGVEDAVIFLGNRADPDVFHAGFDIEALTSLNEGSPFVLIEAMANARPIISTAVGGVVDLLGAVERETDGFAVCERGVRVPPDDPEAFSKGLIYLAKNEKLRGDLEIRGLEYAVSNYSKARLITDVKKLYRDLIRESG